MRQTSVCKVVEDDSVTDYKLIYEKFIEWKTDEEITGFINKAGKFSENEVIRAVEFIKKQGWVELLIHKN
jgi:hypothetical protein